MFIVILKGEGVAYRGRVLLEMKQELSSGKTNSSTHNIHDEDIVRVQVKISNI